MMMKKLLFWVQKRSFFVMWCHQIMTLTKQVRDPAGRLDLSRTSTCKPLNARDQAALVGGEEGGGSGYFIGSD